MISVRLIRVAAQHRVPYIAMHMRGTPADMASHTAYERDIVSEVTDYFAGRIAQLRGAGIEQIVIDPGFGFAKTTEQNYALLSGLSKLTEPGVPVLAGVSRKSMIYNVLGVGPEEALAGTCALNWEALSAGAQILRVHDVKAAKDVVALYEYYENAKIAK